MNARKLIVETLLVASLIAVPVAAMAAGPNGAGAGGAAGASGQRGTAQQDRLRTRDPSHQATMPAGTGQQTRTQAGRPPR